MGAPWDHPLTVEDATDKQLVAELKRRGNDFKARIRTMEITIIGTIGIFQRQIEEYRDNPELLKKRIQLLDALVQKKEKP